MPHKKKATVEEIIRVIHAYLSEEIELKDAAQQLQVHTSTIRRWIRHYKAEGIQFFMPHEHNRVYSAELKMKAVLSYLNSEGGYMFICQKYKIRSTCQLRDWIKLYNAHGDLNSRKHSGGGSYMSKVRNTTQEERVQIAKESLASGKNYGEIAQKYNASYQQVRTWTLRYMELGNQGWKIVVASVRKTRSHVQSWKKDIKSTIKYSRHGCTRNAKRPQYIAENLLDRNFYADKPNEKWLTDVTEFKWYEGLEARKIYLSAILDLYGRRIVAFAIGTHNNNPLVFKTLDEAAKNNPNAHPLFHSDRGFQYTNRVFHHKLEKYGMIQSMSRVAHCIDNGSMEGFWGILKRECYYGKRFTDRLSLIHTIKSYIAYYNNKRVQRSLGILTPIEKHNIYGRIKKADRTMAVDQRKFIFFTVLLTGSSS